MHFHLYKHMCEGGCAWVRLRAYEHACLCRHTGAHTRTRTQLPHSHTHKHTHPPAHTSLLAVVLLRHLSSIAHIYAKPGPCQSVTPLTRSPTSPIRADRARLGGCPSPPTHLPTCQSRARASARLFTVRSHLRLSDATATITEGREQGGRGVREAGGGEEI